MNQFCQDSVTIYWFSDLFIFFFLPWFTKFLSSDFRFFFFFFSSYCRSTSAPTLLFLRSPPASRRRCRPIEVSGLGLLRRTRLLMTVWTSQTSGTAPCHSSATPAIILCHSTNERIEGASTCTHDLIRSRRHTGGGEEIRRLYMGKNKKYKYLL